MSTPQDSSADLITDLVREEKTSDIPTNRWLFGFRTSVHWTRAILVDLATVVTVVMFIEWTVDRWDGDTEATQIPALIQGQGETNERLRQLIAQSGDKARELDLTEKLFISLAERIAQDVPDIDQAYIELKRVVEVAAEEQAKDALPADTDEAVKIILRRVDELNADGQIDTAAELIAEEESRVQAGLLRLYDKGIAQAILTRSVEAARDYELKILPLNTPEPAAQFDALRQVWGLWYERGRDQGLNFDLAVAIALARTYHVRANNADQRRVAQNNLGNALRILGERGSGIELLEEAVIAYRAALEALTRERVPLDWAKMQANLAWAKQGLADHPATANPRSHVETALGRVDAALEIFNTQETPFYHAKATRLRDSLSVRLTGDD